MIAMDGLLFARLQFGLLSATRVRRWLRDGEFDVVHVHEPAPPSLSLLTCIIHEGPLVAMLLAGSPRCPLADPAHGRSPHAFRP